MADILLYENDDVAIYRRNLKANYTIEADREDCILIRDVGPWDKYATVTNAVESVVAELADPLGDRRLYYYDSEGSIDEILVADGKFAGFAFGGPADLTDEIQ